jgi:hypothetical protein
MKYSLLTFIAFLISNLANAQFNPYVPQLPVSQMREVGIYKQNLHNQRVIWVQDEINRLVKVNEYLFNQNKLPADFNVLKHKTHLHKILVDYVNNIKNYDYSDNYYFNSVVENFELIEKYYYDYYNNEVKRYNNKN